MKARRFNWPIWAGFLLSLIAFLSFFSVFARFPLTRDFPWVNLLMFALAGVLLLTGIRRAFAPDRPLKSKIAGVVVPTLSVAVFAFFIFAVFIMAKWLPASQGAPQVGQKAPDFTLADTNAKPFSLSELLSTPINGKPPKAALLVFYRGYW
jgi:hypothetical protein